eukprot:2256475-Rhodomonas_salina.2
MMSGDVKSSCVLREEVKGAEGCARARCYAGVADAQGHRCSGPGGKKGGQDDNGRVAEGEGLGLIEREGCN